jgi:hypothetical protein
LEDCSKIVLELVFNFVSKTKQKTYFPTCDATTESTATAADSYVPHGEL